MALAFVAGGGAGGADATSVTISSLDVSGGAGTFLRVSPAWQKNPVSAPTSVTYNGVACTQLSGALKQHSAAGVKPSVDIYYLYDPASGSHDLVASGWGATPSNVGVGWDTWTGVHATVPFGTPVTNQVDPAAAIKVTITIATGEVGLGCSADTNGGTDSTSDTQSWNYTSGGAGDMTSVGSYVVGSASDMDWAFDASQRAVATAAALKPAAAGGSEISIAGTSTDTNVGKALASVAASSAGTATGTLTGKALAAAALSSAGSATLSAIGKTLASAELASAGAATATFEGAGSAASQAELASAGTSTVAFGGAALVSSEFASSGSASVQWVSGAQAGQTIYGGRIRAESAKRRRQLEQADQELLIALKEAAPYILRHKRTLH